MNSTTNDLNVYFSFYIFTLSLDPRNIVKPKLYTPQFPSLIFFFCIEILGDNFFLLGFKKCNGNF